MKTNKTDITDKDYKNLIKWLIVILCWFIILFVSLFYLPSVIAIGSWLILTGLIMTIKKEKYRHWYNRVFKTNY